jgi:hypothetical protein
VGGLDGFDRERFHERRQARRLPAGQTEDQARQCGRVDDGVLERAVQAAADEPGVERVVAVLDQDSPFREAEEAAADVAELGCADQHRAVDLVSPAGVRIDGRPAVDQSVEEGQRAAQPKALRADLEHQERPVAGCLDVERDEIGLDQRRGRANIGCIDRVLLPLDRLLRAPRLQVEGTRPHRSRTVCRTRSSSLRSTARIRTTTMA